MIKTMLLPTPTLNTMTLSWSLISTRLSLSRNYLYLALLQLLSRLEWVEWAPDADRCERLSSKLWHQLIHYWRVEIGYLSFSSAQNENRLAAFLFLKHINNNCVLNLRLLQLLLRVRSYLHNPSIHYYLTQDHSGSDHRSEKNLVDCDGCCGRCHYEDIQWEERLSLSHLHYHWQLNNSLESLIIVHETSWPVTDDHKNKFVKQVFTEILLSDVCAFRWCDSDWQYTFLQTRHGNNFHFSLVILGVCCNEIFN